MLLLPNKYMEKRLRFIMFISFVNVTYFFHYCLEKSNEKDKKKKVSSFIENWKMYAAN